MRRLWVSFSVDPQGIERNHARDVISLAPSSALVVLDAPRHLCLRTWVEEHFPTGDWQHLDYVTSHLGSFSARRRNLSLRGFGAPLELDGARSVPPPALSVLPLDANASPSSERGTLTQEPTLVTTGDKWLPRPFGHWAQGARKHLVRAPTGLRAPLPAERHPSRAGAEHYCLARTAGSVTLRMTRSDGAKAWRIPPTKVCGKLGLRTR